MELAPGARTIVEVCAGTKRGEKLLILTDTGISPRIAEALAIAGKAAGAVVTVMTMSPLSRPGEEPPAMVAAAMTEADVILSPTTRTLYHSQAAINATAKGARLIVLTEMTEQMLISGGIEADFMALQPRVKRVVEAFAAGESVHVTSPGGTDITLKLTGRLPYTCSGICHKPGEKMGFPDIEVFVAPIEDQTNGILVIDASATAIGLMDAPVTLTIEKGLVKSVEGGRKAAEIRDILEKAGSASAYVVAEFALGLNDRSHIIGNIIEDEGTYGTGHFALGSNVFFGGANSAPIHFDMVYWHPTVEIDGELLMQDGILTEQTE